MAILNLFENLISRAPKVPLLGEVNFTIYNSDILQDINTDDPLTANGTYAVAATFQGMHTFDYRSSVDIPYEPLENGQFSNDSWVGKPYQIGIVAECSPVYSIRNGITNDESKRNYIGKVIDMLRTAQNSAQLLVILQNKPLFSTYENIKLTEFAFDLSADKTSLVTYMKFQQIRITNSEYDYTPPANVKTANLSSQMTVGARTTQPLNNVQIQQAAGL